MDKQNLFTLASRLITAGLTQNNEEIESISSELAAELRQSNELDGGTSIGELPPNGKAGFLKFTKKENNL